jgi:xanthine dehydrogenase small subunit
MRKAVRFYRNGRLIERADLAPATTLLDYLRLEEHATGTKEGCAECDCGACTVVLRRLRAGKLVYEPVNACILLAGQADGAEVIAVEDIAGESLHPVQQALVDHHGSQCGFCTPGFVMAGFALYHDGGARPPSRDRVVEAISGNLCRCTGYRPIVDGTLQACAKGASDKFTRDAKEAVKRLKKLDDGKDVFAGSEKQFFAAPASVTSLAKLYLKHPDATLVGGNTDAGLWITKELRALPKIIWLGRVKGFDKIENKGSEIRFGAGVKIEAASRELAKIDSDLGELFRRFGGWQVRSAATLGGNIANGSPIGDSPPALIALGAMLELQRGAKTRTIPLEKFFIEYRKQDRKRGEFVRAVRVPRLQKGEPFRCFKLSKRYDQDISGVFGAVKLRLSVRRIADARIAFGGMAGTPKRAKQVEAKLKNVSLDDRKAIEAAVNLIAKDFTPLSDMRASADYRLAAAKGLLLKAILEIASMPSAKTRVFGRRADAQAA